MNFAITTVCPAGHEHIGAFAEVSDSFHHALLQLGHQSTQAVNVLFSDARNIILGANTLGPEEPLPENSILVNLEQLESNTLLPPHYFDRLLHHTVWDYSAANVRLLRSRGARNVTRVRLGYVPELTRISGKEPDIDVLFYGSLNPRRLAVLDQLSAAGARVERLFGLYGAERDAYISRSKIVLNMHFYEAKVLEVVRIFYLLANGVFVVSERGADTEESGRFEGGLAFSGYEQLGSTCLRYLGDPRSRQLIAARGQGLIRQQEQTQYLAPAIAALR